MVEPYVKDGAITYTEFDNLFNFLSRKEQYLVSELLFVHHINLCDDNGQEMIIEDSSEEEIELSYFEEVDDVNEFEVLYDESIFKDSKSTDNGNGFLVVNHNVKQSNEILCKLIQEGSLQAKQDICIKNQRLVDKYAISYTNYYGNHLDFEDIEQAGFVGLLKAAEKFDITKGYVFSTYAVYWIRQAIVREIYDNGFVIRVPVHMMEHINKVTCLDNKYGAQKIPYEERIELISQEVGFYKEFVEQCLVIRRNFLSYSSLNTPLGEEEDIELEEFITDKEAPLVEDIVSSHILREQLEEAISTLKEREQKVLRLRFGLDDDKKRSLEEIGKEFNVTRERIRQIEAKALRKLRQPLCSKKLKDFL